MTDDTPTPVNEAEAAASTKVPTTWTDWVKAHPALTIALGVAAVLVAIVVL